MYSNFIFTEDKLGIRLNALKDEKGIIWFIGKEVAEILEYKNTAKSIRDNVQKNHKKTIRNKDLGVTSTVTPENGLVLNNFGAIIIDECGFYRLVMKSKMPKAEEFQDWVCGEVLPSLRKNNYYIDKENIDNTQLDKLKEEIKELKDKLSLYDNKDYYSIFDIRKMLNATSKEFECKSFTLAKTSEEMHIPARHELGEYNNEPCYYKKYHFLIWCSVYSDWFSIDSEHGLKVKKIHEKFKDII